MLPTCARRKAPDAGELLVVNAGSSSIKFEVFDEALDEVLSGSASEIGGAAQLQIGGARLDLDMPDHGAAMDAILAKLCAIEDRNSKSITMGYSPLDGLIMGTRSGRLIPMPCARASWRGWPGPGCGSAHVRVRSCMPMGQQFQPGSCPPARNG